MSRLADKLKEAERARALLDREEELRRRTSAEGGAEHARRERAEAGIPARSGNPAAWRWPVIGVAMAAAFAAGNQLAPLGTPTVAPVAARAQVLALRLERDADGFAAKARALDAKRR
jgi:hypothetical protein